MKNLKTQVKIYLVICKKVTTKKLLLKALNLESNNVNILLNLSMCCQGIGESNEAKNYALKVIDLDPNNTSAHKLLSTLVDYNNDQKYLNLLSLY